MSERRAVVVGGGLAGLAASAALARHGFSVRLLEKNRELREFGAGIYLKENSLPVLDELGIGARIEADGARIASASIVDERRRIIVRRDLSEERLVVVLRANLHSALLDAATTAGVDVVAGQEVTAVAPSGRVTLADGTELTADLVVGADGVGSRVRESLGLTKATRTLGDGATRVVVPRREEPHSVEHWSGDRRVGIVPCGDDTTYAFIIGPERERRATRLPLDREYWSAAFPHLTEFFHRVPDDAGVHHAHVEVKCHSWTRGRVVLVGDAAHAQPPNLGQGAGLAIAATWALARHAATGDLTTALAAWQREVRSGIDMVQRLTTAYDIAGYRWPRSLYGARARLFHTLSTFPPTARRWEYWWRGGTDRPVPPTNAPDAPSRRSA